MSDSSSCVSLTMKVVAALFVIIFLITLPLGLLALATSSMIFSPDLLTQSVTEQLVDSGILRRSLAEFLPTSDFLRELSSDAEVFRAFQDLDVDEWERLIDMVLPPEFLESQIERSVMAINIWLDNDRALPGVEIDIRPIKTNLQGGASAEIVEMVVDSWPSCTTGEVARIAETINQTGTIPIIFCEPPEPYRSQLVDFANRQFLAFSRELPPTFQLSESDPSGSELDQVLLLKERIRMIRTLGLAGWLLPLAMLGLIMVLAIRSWRDLAIWWGLPIFLAGVFTIGLSLSADTLSRRVIGQFLGSLQPSAGPFNTILRVALSGVREDVFDGVLGAGIMVSFLGLVIMLVAWFLSRLTQSRRSAQVQAPSSEQVAPPPAGPPPGVVSSPPPVAPLDEDREEGEKPSGIFG